MLLQLLCRRPPPPPTETSSRRLQRPCPRQRWLLFLIILLFTILCQALNWIAIHHQMKYSFADADIFYRVKATTTTTTSTKGTTTTEKKSIAQPTKTTIPNMATTIVAAVAPSTLTNLTFGSASRTNSRQSSTMPPTTTVAYIVTLTSCSKNFRSALFDVGRVLRHSIETNSHPNHPTARYAAHFYVIVPPNLAGEDYCVEALQRAGYTRALLPLPVVPDDIAVYNESIVMLKSRIHKNGCCGHLELLKLYAFAWTNYSIAVYLDLDTLVTQPLDELFDAIYYPPTSPQGVHARQHLVQQGIVAPTFEPVVPVMNMTIDAFFSRDYNMLPIGKEKRAGMQGGFLVVRPNATRYQELVGIVKSGNFLPGQKMKSGWFGMGYGMHIWGAMTIQGLLAYYFDQVIKDSAIELHRCKFNQIMDNPRRTTFHRFYPRQSPAARLQNASWHDTSCRDGRRNCDDVQCQTWPMNDTRMVHYTYCKVPWRCASTSPSLDRDLFLGDANCRGFFKLWFDMRREVRGSEIIDEEDGLHPHIYGGFCKTKGDYIPIQGMPLIDRVETKTA